MIEIAGTGSRGCWGRRAPRGGRAAMIFNCFQNRSRMVGLRALVKNMGFYTRHMTCPCTTMCSKTF